MTRDNRFDLLPSEIIRREKQLEHEAVTGRVWKTDTCPVEASQKIANLVAETTNAAWRVFEMADRRMIILPAAEGGIGTSDLLRGSGTDEDRLDAVAAVVLSFLQLASFDDEPVDSGSYHQADEDPRYDKEIFLYQVNDLLLASRVEWHFEDDHFVRLGNSTMHTAIVKPASILLDLDPRFARASSGFQLALTRLSDNQPDVAITDAASAVQEFFRCLDVYGQSVSDQLNNAQKKGIITTTDKKLLKPLFDWVNADRSDKGNAHAVRNQDSTRADAWLAIHVAGALMVRLSDREPREIMAAREKRELQRVAEAEASERAERERAAEATRARENDVWNTPGTFPDSAPF